MSIGSRTSVITVALSMLAGFAAAPGVAQTPAGTTATAAAALAPDLKRGRLLYIQCRACHELKAGEPNKVGPNLHGFIGRKAAAVPDFAFSAALKNSNLTWDRATIEKWLEKPSGLVPGNSMAFAGISSPTDRASLMAYLEAETK
jgi:cytochrome c